MTATANHSEVSAVPQTDNRAQSMRATIAIAISIVALVVSGISIAGWTQASGERRRVENRLACLELPGPNGLRPRRRLDRTSVRRIGAHSREVGIVASIDQWELRGDQGAPADGSRVRLHNRVVNESLKRERRENGIDLVWDAASEAPNSTFEKEGGGPMWFAAPVAIAIDGGGFLSIRSATQASISGGPSARSIDGRATGGPPREPVPANQPIGLLNTEHGDHLIDDRRSSGINLRWYADWGLSIAFNPQPMFARYPPLPIPNRLRSPGRESAPIQIEGEARVVSLFHGASDDELDWHVYVSPSARDRSTLTAHMRAHARGAGDVTDRMFDSVYCELMVLDGWNNTWFDEFFFSADVRRAFSLSRPAWDYSVEAGEAQGSPSLDVTDESRLGAFPVHGCACRGHSSTTPPRLPTRDTPPRLDRRGTGTRRRPPHDRRRRSAWPESDLTWRVAVFTNSQTHRINGADYVKQDRVTTWHLPLPRAANPRPTGPTPLGTRPALLGQVTVAMSEPGSSTGAQGRDGLDEARPSPARYDRHRVISERHRIIRAPGGGDRFLQVRVALDRPNDRWGGMFLADYRVRVAPPVVEL